MRIIFSILFISFAIITQNAAYADEYTVLCPANYYIVDEHCEQCPTNMVSSGGNVFECTCPEDYYIDGESCIACPTHTTSPGNNATKCDGICPDGKYWNGAPFLRTCIDCPDEYPHSDLGTGENRCYSDVKFREWDGTVECREMPDGCTTATCTVCESEPEPCEYVEYSDGEIKSGCTTNPCITNIVDDAKLYGGVYNSESNKCELCAPGTYYTKDKKTGAGECIACPTGTYSTTGAIVCISCPAGTYRNSDASECTPCPAGMYSNAGAWECAACPAGTTSVAAATSIEQCIAEICDAGYYMDNGVCTKCPDEYPNSEIASTTISQCYSDVKYREWTGEQITPDIPTGCADAVYGECSIDACEYIQSRRSLCPPFLPDCGIIKSGCETNNESCTKPILSVTANPGYIVNGITCEQCPAGTYSTGTECISCPAGTYSNAGATECTPCDQGKYANATIGATGCERCPGGTHNPNIGAADSSACIQCSAGTYSVSVPAFVIGGASECAQCPDDYPNSEPGSAGIGACYSDEKLRPWTGRQVCAASTGCIGATCDKPCEIKPCKYVEYYWVQPTCPPFNPNCAAGLKPEIKSGCETNDANCSTPVTALIAVPGWRAVGIQRCEKCPAGTYSVGGENATCEPCPDDATTPDGATTRDECMRILNYLQPGKTTPTKISLKLKKNSSPAFAVQIKNDVFYGDMTPVDAPNKPGLYVGYNNQKYQIVDNTFVGDVMISGSDRFIIITTPDTTTFEFTVYASGEFTVDWGDGNVENFSSSATKSHTYNTTEKHIIWLSGRATEYFAMGPPFLPFSTLSFSNTSQIEQIYGSLGAVFPTLPDGTNPLFYGLFKGASNLTGKIPSNLFAGITGSPSTAPKASLFGMFGSIFEGCSRLTGQIPAGLFGDLSGAPGAKTFQNAFNGCSGLTGPAARNPDGMPLYYIEYNGQTWYEQSPDAFTDMYTGSGISD